MSETFGTTRGEPSSDDRWLIAQGLEGDQPVLFRLLSRRPAAVEPILYRHMFAISWPYESENDSGLPSVDTMDRMSLLEELLEPALEKPRAAFLTIVATGSGLRQWHWYARDPQEMMALVNEALAGREPFPIEFSLEDDPEWRAYDELRGNLDA